MWSRCSSPATGVSPADTDGASEPPGSGVDRAMALHARVVGRYGWGDAITYWASNHHCPTPLEGSEGGLRMMPTNMTAPELLCAVRAGSAMMLEMWFLGGDGSRDDLAVVTLIGELDSHGARPVPAAAEELIQRVGPWVIFDLSGVTFRDGRGLAVLIHLRHHAERRGGRIAVSRPRRPVSRILQLAGCDEGLVLQGAAR